MNRSSFLAALVLVAVVGGLVATQFRSDDDEATSPAGQQASTDGISEDQDGDAAGGADQSDDDTDDAADDEQPETIEVVDPPPVLDPKPALTNLDGWLQTDATSLDDFAGQVRIVEFWTFGCFNCKNRLPFTQAIYEEYQPQGLEIIGVHAPEFDFERDPERIAQAAVDLGVTWPIALDTEKTNFRAWQESRRFWPRVYVLDQNGDVRYDHIGEGDYDGLEEVVAHLIENGP
ncbi:MAG: redoxin domain-containing protein [Actinomycetota bacterium]